MYFLSKTKVGASEWSSLESIGGHASADPALGSEEAAVAGGSALLFGAPGTPSLSAAPSSLRFAICG